MRLRFQQKPCDLFAAIAFAGGLGLFSITSASSELVFIIFATFVPGYVTLASVFPAEGELGWPERIILSVGTSIVIFAISSVAFDSTPFLSRVVPPGSSLSLFVVVLALFALWRRLRLPERLRLSVTVLVHFHKDADKGHIELALAAISATLVVATTVTLAAVLSHPRSPEPFTELYLVGPDGTASSEPTHLQISENATISVVITNHELARTNYTLRVDLVGVVKTYNSSAGVNETIELNRTVLTRMNISLLETQNWTEKYEFSIPNAGYWRIEFLLFKTVELPEPYRAVYLYIRVP